MAAAAAAAAAMELDDVAGDGGPRGCGEPRWRGIVHRCGLALFTPPLDLALASSRRLLQLLLTPTSLPCCASQRPEL